MKELKYIYTLLIAMLLGIISFACTDEEDTEQLEKGDDTTDVRGGRFITTTITVSTAAPDLSVDLEGTRAGNDKANIEHDQTENGGRFQNVVVVVTNDKDSVYAIHCNKWYGDRPTSTGVKQYEVIFPDVQIYTTNGKKAKVYAFGNVDMDRWNTINGYTVEATRKLISEYAEINNLMKAQLKVDKKDIYNIRFVPESGNYKVDDDEVTNTCTGMPVNGTADAEVKKGATKFSVHMRRVCARLQVTFRNFTGTYKVNNNIDSSNKVYVDEFVIKKVLATTTNYFHDSVAKGNDYTPSEPGNVDFDILKALGGSMTNDHEINKIENGKDLTVSMYVFENKKGTASGDYTYNLKVDRGKNLGSRAKSLEDGNVYVMWSDNLDIGGGILSIYENSYNRCLGANANNEIIYGESLKYGEDLQGNYYSVMPFGTYTLSNPYGNRVFWKFHKSADNTGSFENCNVDLSNDKCEGTNYYIPSSGFAKLNKGSGHFFSIVTQNFDGYNRSYLLIRKTSSWLMGTTYYTLMISGDVLQERSFPYSSIKEKKPYYPWVFFAKYIIKKNKLFGEGKDEAVTQYEKITRNSSYSMDFSVMPNYEMKQELLVNCVRDQKTISWESVDK